MFHTLAQRSTIFTSPACLHWLKKKKKDYILELAHVLSMDKDSLKMFFFFPILS